MKILFALLFSLQCFAANIDMSKPPYWLSSFDEMNRLRKSQKAFLVGKLEPVFEKIPSLKEFTKAKLQDVIKDPDRWSDLRMKVYIYCSDTAALKTCENLAEIRLQTFDVDALTQMEPKPSPKTEKKK